MLVSLSHNELSISMQVPGFQRLKVKQQGWGKCRSFLPHFRRLSTNKSNSQLSLLFPCTVKSTSSSINTAAIAVAAVSLILIGTFVAIITVQCVFIARKGRCGKAAAKGTDVSLSSNEAYMSSLKMKEEAIYEAMK